MATIKYSKQREAIRSFLMTRKDHPTAEVVYENVREEFPNISLGTVYRNLTFLVDKGQAVKVPCNDGSVHFDGNVSPPISLTNNEELNILLTVVSHAPSHVIIKNQELLSQKLLETFRALGQ